MSNNSRGTVLAGFPTPPSSATDPPPLCCTGAPFIWGCVTTLFIITFLSFFLALTSPPCHVSVSVESISVSPSFGTWHIDFLVRNPTSSSCSIINYEDDDVYVKIGFLNAAVLKTSHTYSSRGHASFSVDLVTSNRSDIVAPRVFELDMKLSGKKYGNWYREFVFGHFDVRCQDLMIGHENVKCHSSFRKLKELKTKDTCSEFYYK